MSKQNTFRLIIETLIKVPTGALGVVLDILRRIIHKRTGEQFTEDLKDWLRGAKELVPKPLIKWLGVTTVQATTEKFVAKYFFTTKNKEVKIFGVWSNFRYRFLDGKGKIEDPIEEQELRYGNLTRGSVADPIIEELGGKEKSETTLQELAEMMKRQANGEVGKLLTNGLVNIFYIKDTGGVLQTVLALWQVNGWSVYASSVECSIEQSSGGRVFSRNS